MVTAFSSWQKYYKNKKLDPEHKSIIEEMDSILLSMNASSVISEQNLLPESPSKFLITFSNDFT